MLRCLQRVRKRSKWGSSNKLNNNSCSNQVLVFLVSLLTALRCKDRLNSPLESGYRDVLLNVCDVHSGFVELQLNFSKIA